MKKIALQLLLLFPLALQAGDTYARRIYVAGDLFHRNYHEMIEKPAEADEHGGLYGYMFGYDYFKKWDFYRGFEFGGSYGKVDYDGAKVNLDTGHIRKYNGTSIHHNFNWETRYGFAFAVPYCQELTIAPFVGFGYQRWLRDVDFREKYRWFYWNFGLKSAYVCLDWLDIEFHIKFNRMAYGTLRIEELGEKDVHLRLGNKWHCVIEFPFRFYPFQGSRHIDLSFVPYYKRQNLGESTKKVINIPLPGVKKVSVFEPESRSRSIGARFEAGMNF